MAQRFEAAYGIPTRTLRIESDKLLARITTEQRGGRFEADAVGTTGFQADQLKRAGIFAAYRPPEADALLGGTVDPDATWSAVILNTATIAYNPVRLKAAGIAPPRTWEDLAAKEWRGRFGLFSGSYEWFAALKKFYGTERAEGLLRAYAANQPRLLASHQLGISLTEAGEVDAAPNVYGYDVVSEKAKGQPIALVNPTPTVIEIYAISVTKTAAHPNAARLLARWLLARETQQWIRTALGRVSPRKDVQNDPALLDPRVRYAISNPADSATYNDDVRAFNAIFAIP